MASNWDKRYFAGTRGHVLLLLRRASRTIDDIARELELTPNAVRAHVTLLERDGLVEQQGSRRTGRGRKPALLYRLTDDAERLFPKAHEALVPYLLDALHQQDPAAESDGLRQIGRRMAAGRTAPSDDMPTRLQKSLALLRELGGLPEVETSGGGYTICGYSCPFAPLARTHPQLCFVAQGMLTEILRAPVEVACERGEATPLWCRFEVHAGVVPPSA
jgi:predicted ArsR family transcriptional regulator